MSDGVIPLSYYTGVPNVGDLANADLVSAVGGVPSYQTRDVERPHLLAVGSVMEWAQPSSIIWGTGVMDPAKGIGGATANNIHALRGQMTLACLKDHGVVVDVPLGDPAYLLPELLHITPKIRSGRLGIVPHYVNQADPFFVDLREQGAHFIDVTTLCVRDFLEEMSTCEFIVSSSLHGLIFAEALGIGNLWVETGNAVHGDGFKFRDWFSTTRRPQHNSFRPQNLIKINDLSPMCDTHHSIINKNDLKSAFPRFLLIESGRPLPNCKDIITVDQCRIAPIHIFIDASTDMDPDRLDTTFASAMLRLHRPRFIIVGKHADSVEKLDLCGSSTEIFTDHACIDAAFMKFFYDRWAEPQRHAIVEVGFDFSDIDIADELDGELRRKPHLEAVVLDRDGRRIVYRRPGRWW